MPLPTSPRDAADESLSRDRLITTLFFAGLLHGIVILGVGFSPEDRAPGTQPQRMEVTLVTGRAGETPEEADYYAQIDQRGEGSTTEQVRPRARLSAQAIMSRLGIPQAPDPLSLMPDRRKAPEPNALRAEAVEITSQLVTTSDGSRSVASRARSAGAAPTERLHVSRLVESRLEDVTATDQRTVEAQATSRNPREKFVSVNTRSHVFAPYLHQWRMKVEQVGRLNFPDEARRQGLYGSVTVEVALRADGHLQDVTIVDSAEHRLLDRAVLRILQLAAPFAPFSEPMRRETDVLRFAYEWRFLPGGKGTPRGRVLTDS